MNWIALFLWTFLTSSAFSQTEVHDLSYGASLDIPAVDLPFNSIDGYQAPSMAQSLQLSKASHQWIHWRFSQILNPRHNNSWASFGARMALFGIDTAFGMLPLGTGWLHEEWHRAVMTRRGISSYNGIYDFHIGASTIPVRKVTDEDLSRLKRDHPAESVRMSAAGMEAERELVQGLEGDIFFGRSKIWMGSTLLLSVLSPIGYMQTCANPKGDKLTEEMNQQDTKMADRDFTGLDCLGWVYDLFRRDEAYEARGVHPSGVGVDRYRTYGQLTAAERRYLRRTAERSYLNIIDPFVFDIDEFSGIGPLKRFNATVRHHITSFGESIDLNLYTSWQDTDLYIVNHYYQNHEKVFPGLELKWVRLPVNVGGRGLYLTPRAMWWQQPKEQDFWAKTAKAGGLLSLRVESQDRAWHPYAEISGKTEGWVAGEVFLDANLSVRGGMSRALF